MTPLNLRVLYGNRFVIRKDREAAESSKDRSPWLFQIKTRVGHVYPHSATHLAIECDGHPKLAAELARRGLVLHQDGANEKTFLATLDQFEQVVPLIRPRRKRMSVA